ncbi:MAG: S-layer homology domain-containing protein [Synechococcaceae cyanobacterium SM2_3_1]|nr:S-layer homology domain-containing protein [Synechococcaceae cyanobacterium SM2_3_1]
MSAPTPEVELPPEPSPEAQPAITPSPPIQSTPIAPPLPEVSPQPLTSTSTQFTDLEAISKLAHTAITNLELLGVFAHIDSSTFDPEQSIKRGEFARWLVLANNAIHQGEPSRQIRLAQRGERPIFLDVPEDHPDFIYIQALGSAGLVEGDENQEFRPDSLLSRAELIRFKLPLDVPPGAIEGDLQQIQAQWGFTDTEQIPEVARAAIATDRTLGENSTILRTFGPIRAFNPFEPVTRAEAALALSAFANQTAAAIPSALLLPPPYLLLRPPRLLPAPLLTQLRNSLPPPQKRVQISHLPHLNPLPNNPGIILAQPQIRRMQPENL